MPLAAIGRQRTTHGQQSEQKAGLGPFFLLMRGFKYII